MTNSPKNCLLCGVGGQGTVLASKLIASCAMEKGKNVRTAETIGMAQRGGSVVSHVRIGDKIHSPMIGPKSADVIIGFEPGEAVRCLPYLKCDGLMIVCQNAINPVTASLGNCSYNHDETIAFLQNNVSNLILIDGDEICKQCGSNKILNVALLGAAINSGKLDLCLNDIENAIKSRLPEKFHTQNLQALKIGAEYANQTNEVSK